MNKSLHLFCCLFIFLSFFATFSSAEQAPNFTLKDCEKNEYTLSDYGDDPIFLLFFQEENFDIDLVRNIIEDYTEFQVVFFAITTDRNRDWKVEGMPLLFDEEQAVFSDYEINEELAVVLIDKEGELKAKIFEFDEIEIRSNLNQILGVTGIEGVTWGKIKSLYIH